MDCSFIGAVFWCCLLKGLQFPPQKIKMKLVRMAGVPSKIDTN